VPKYPYVRIAAATLFVAVSLPGNALERVGHSALVEGLRPHSPTSEPHPIISTGAPPESISAAPPQCSDPRGVPRDLRACRLLSTGAIDTTWNPAEGTLCVSSLAGLNPTVVADQNGGAFVGWVDSRRGEPDIYLQRLTSSASAAQGWPAGGIPVCQSEHSQYQLDVIADGADGVYLAWQDYRSRRVGQVFLQHLGTDGLPAAGWEVGGKAITDTLVEQSSPRLALTPEGGVYVAWQGRHDAVLGLYLQQFASTGSRTVGWPANGRAIDEGPGDNLSPVAARDSLGRVLIVWQQVDSLRHRSLVATELPSNLDPANWNPEHFTLVDAADEFSPVAVVRGTGSTLLAVWEQRHGGVTSFRAQQLRLGPMKTDWQPGGATVHEGPIAMGMPIALPDTSGALVAWADLRNGTDSDIYVQRLTTGGAIAVGWPGTGVPVATGARNQYAPWLASDGAGGTIVTWADPPVDTRVRSSSPAHASSKSLPTLGESRATPGHARVVWTGAAAFVESLEVERRLPGADWTFLVRLAPDDSGRVVFEDRSAPSGSHVAYRLALIVQGTRVLLDPVELDIPRAPLTLALHWARFEGGNSLHIAFAFPAGPAPSVDIMDVAGRRIMHQDLNGLEPDEHETSVRLSSTLSSGVYFVRLRQGSQARVAKTVLIR
jgi:hypothetical protein